MIFLLALIAVAIIWGAVDLATEHYRNVMREQRRINRRRHRWPREQHFSYFRDLKRANFNEDLH